MPTDATALDVTWMIVAAGLVFVMQVGFCALEAGFVRARNTINVAAKNLIDFCVAGAVFWAVGFGLMFGARPTHGPGGVLFLYVAAAGIAALGTGWGLGLAFRFRDMRAAAIMQLTFFLLIFLTDAQTPLFIMEGWLESAARINPFTNIIRLALLGFLDAPITSNNIWGCLIAIVAISALTLAFARRSLDRLSDS